MQVKMWNICLSHQNSDWRARKHRQSVVGFVQQRSQFGLTCGDTLTSLQRGLDQRRQGESTEEQQQRVSACHLASKVRHSSLFLSQSAASILS